jgi:hypothetical protein
MAGLRRWREHVGGKRPSWQWQWRLSSDALLEFVGQLRLGKASSVTARK